MRCRSRLLAIVVPAMVVSLGAAPGALAQEPSLEYQVKAAFLFNFAQFVDWPPAAFPSPTTPVTLCVAGEDPFGALLDRLVAGEVHDGRPFAVRRVAPAGELSGCQLLFVPRTERARAAAILARAVGPATLTVGEFPEFLAAGGMMNFFLEENKVRFEIHQSAAEQAGLRISSHLLRLARVSGAVDTEPQPYALVP
jgi:hypothetical protein